jgi:rSAM/selenodomain-associated transferase 1
VQRGADLGERMQFALAGALERHNEVVLVGSDCPQIDHAMLDAAFAALRQHDAVFAPAVDGGYALIGLRRSHARLFLEIPWSTAQVMPRTRGRLLELGWDWHELDPVRDVDTPDDLDYFQALGSPFSDLLSIGHPDAMA